MKQACGVKPTLQQVSFAGMFLSRGFWLYVWEIFTMNSQRFYYVGRTGDKSSGASQSPFDRFSKHLGSNKNNNALRRQLEKRRIDPERCTFRFHAFGPLFRNSTANHGQLCDLASGLEKALAEDMRSSGYELLNQVHCRKPIDQRWRQKVLAHFTSSFPKLAAVNTSRSPSSSSHPPTP